MLWYVAYIVVATPVIIFLFVEVHRVLDRICVGHARRFCEKNGLKVTRFRWQPAFDPTGVKTEFTLVQLDCLDAQMQRKLVLLVVWPFGFRGIRSNEKYPDSYDEKWPLAKS
jgi:hypothetical protein